MSSIRRRVAFRLAEGKKTYEAIAAEHGINPRSICRWLRDDETFRELVDEKRKAIEDELKGQIITTRIGRVGFQIERHRKLQELIEQRAKHYQALPTAVGGSTGLVYEKIKKDGTEYQYDSAVIRDLLEIEKAIGEEMGHVSPDSESDVTIISIPQFPLQAKPVAEDSDQNQSDVVPTE